ncbi:hypothetical protein [Enterococcus sp.]|uniref:hypothetical protein n=1 Tax=Enterococcus sp. TaxID=35783 RepID=UPI003C770D7B
MATFFTVYTKAQQFLLLQAYADEVMTEEELMQFVIEETKGGRFLFVSNQSIYLVTPHVSLADFEKVAYRSSEVQLQQKGSELIVTTPTENLRLELGSPEEATRVLSDFKYLLNQQS